MSVSLRPFFISLFLFSLAVLGILLLWQHFASARFQTSYFWIIWVFFVGSTALIHSILTKTARQDPKKFVNYFMGITALKLFAYLTIIMLFGLLNRDHAVGFIICFLISYFLYTIFEVVSLMKHFKK